MFFIPHFFVFPSSFLTFFILLISQATSPKTTAIIPVTVKDRVLAGQASRYPRLKPWHSKQFKLGLTPFGRLPIHPRACPWNSALRVVRVPKKQPPAKPENHHKIVFNNFLHHLPYPTLKWANFEK